MVKKRNSNLELYRILLMLAIVAHHFVVNSELFHVLQSESLSLKSGFFYIFGMWGKTGINCFVLITGYYMCTSQITIKKFLKLILEVEFYQLFFFVIFILYGYVSFSWKACFKAFLPVSSVADGFTSSFILFYLFIPFINILIKNITKHQHQMLISLCVFIFTILGTTPFFYIRMNYVEWFCVLYFISSYIRLYDVPWKFSASKWGLLLCLSILLSILSVIGMVWIGEKPYLFVSDSNKLMAVVVSILAFMYFKKLQIPYCKIINTIAQSVFGVLLIHANSDAMRQWLWIDTVNVVGNYHTNTSISYSILCILSIYILFTTIDQIRIHFVEKPLLKKINNLVEKYT